MANKKNNIEKTKNNVKKSNISSPVKENKNNTIQMKILVFLGVAILFVAIVYLMNYFFVEKSYIKINISTDKKLEYIEIEGERELISTQKYVSDLNYSMRYDIDNFEVFKYKTQDIYKFINNERVLVVVEESLLPNSCSAGSLDMIYNNCYVKVDDYTEEHYISTNGKTYRITVKSPNTSEYESGVKTRINYMLSSFEIK